MLRSNSSVGGKLLLIFITFLLTIALIVGMLVAHFYAVPLWCWGALALLGLGGACAWRRPGRAGLMLIGVAVNLLLCVFPPVRAAFGITLLSPAQWALVFGASLSVIPLAEGYKAVCRLLPTRASVRPAGCCGCWNIPNVCSPPRRWELRLWL